MQFKMHNAAFLKAMYVSSLVCEQYKTMKQQAGSPKPSSTLNSAAYLEVDTSRINGLFS